MNKSQSKPRAQTAKTKGKRVGFEDKSKNEVIEGATKNTSSTIHNKKTAITPKNMEFFVEKANVYEKFK